MKIKVILLAVLVASAVLISSCSLLGGLSIEMRIAQFQSDLNSSNVDGIQDNFSIQCEAYNQLNTAAYWNGNSIFNFDNRKFVISITSTSDVDAYGNITYKSGGAGPLKVHFKMVDEGLLGGWKILKVWTGDNDSNEQIKVLSY